MGQGGVRDEMRTVPCVTSEEKIKHTKNTSETCKYFICVCIYILNNSFVIRTSKGAAPVRFRR